MQLNMTTSGVESPSRFKLSMYKKSLVVSPPYRPNLAANKTMGRDMEYNFRRAASLERRGVRKLQLNTFGGTAFG